ncbi:MAG TPA: MG2 domain-containing protein, partial [Bryobacteraceae bacterium]
MLLVTKDNKTALKTNSEGLFDQSVSIHQGEGLQPLVLAKTGNSFAASSFAAYSVMNRVDDYNGYTYTDRPVYRPGHAVSFKGILRVKKGNVNVIPTMKNISVEVTGPEDKKFYQKTLDMDPYGSVAGDFTLPKDAPLGTYSVNMHAADTLVGGTFEVQEYKKPEYEVRVTPAKPRVLQGDDIPVTIDAKYFFGEPVANAKVEYVLHRATYWDWGFYGEPDDDAPQQMQQDYQGDTDEQVLDETAKLDADGKLEVRIPTKMDDHGMDVRYRIEARVTDEGNREITGSASVLATYGSFRVRISPAKWFVSPGEMAAFNVSAGDYDNHPISTPVTVSLLVYSARDKGFNEVSTVTGQTDAQGNTRVQIKVPEDGGGFEARVKAKTPEGRQVSSMTWLFAGGNGWGDMEGEERRIQLIPDQKHYAPGDTAHVLIVTGVKHAKVLISVEGSALSQLRIVEANGPTVTVDIPITSDSTPDIFVSASFFFENEFYNGNKMLKVPPNERKLQVEIKSSKPQYTPGEGAQFTVDAKDAAGKPVTAELSLGVVDEAIYGIQPDKTPDATQVFYGTQYNEVMTDSSLNYYFHGEAGKRRMQLAALRPHRSFSAIKPDRLVMPKVRKAFPDTTLWLPRLMTDANGYAVANFAFPDSITAWRATARAITLDTKVGGAVLKTIVRKNVILRLVTPRFFTMGDEVTISAIAHNYLAAGKVARMTLDVKGLDILDPGPRQVTIDAKGEAKVDWRVRATRPGQATLTGAVLTDEESDAMELPIPINAYGVKLTEARSGAVNNSGSADISMQFPAQSVPQSHSIDVTVSPSVAGAMFAALDYLTAFPYGCTEQTMSSFLPNVIVTRAIKELGVSADVNQEVLAAKTKAGLDRLADFQHEDGGWGWWKTDESEVFMTAYVVSGLAQAKSAGVAVNDDSLQRGMKWLRAAYTNNSKMIADLKAYVVYALSQAGPVDAQALDDAWGVRDKLSPDGAALLGLTFDAAKSADRAATLVKRLEGDVKTDEAHAWWPSDRDYLMDYWFDTSSETTAMAVKLLSHVKPDSPLLPKAVLYLMDHRQGYYWYSTKQTAMVIAGLTDYLKRSGELKPSLQAAITVNGKQVFAKSFGAADALSPVAEKVTITASDLSNGNQVHVQSTGTGRLYWSVTERYSSTEQKHVKEGSTDLNLLRDYYKLTPQKNGDAIVYSLDKVDGPLAVGDVLAVRLTITGS